ncbi:hypothetical protein BJY52DRAFT_1190616 [Lactarius psammicola]|nr:hypothetical protein BJY52DRAFT_1190616 [Lactarius psammicola]
MTQAEFDKHRGSVLTASQDPLRVHSPSVTASPHSSQTAPPIPTISRCSVPSSSFAPRTSPAIVANPFEVTVRPAPKPVRQAAVLASAGHVFSSRNLPLRRAGLKRARPDELTNTTTIPKYVRWDYCTHETRVAFASASLLVQGAVVSGNFLATNGGCVSLSQVQAAVSVIVWHAEVARANPARELAEGQEQFAQERYAEALRRVVAPGKGKGKARSKVVEEHNDEEDELADAGESEVDEVKSSGYATDYSRK